MTRHVLSGQTDLGQNVQALALHTVYLMASRSRRCRRKLAMRYEAGHSMELAVLAGWFALQQPRPQNSWRPSGSGTPDTLYTNAAKRLKKHRLLVARKQRCPKCWMDTTAMPATFCFCARVAMPRVTRVEHLHLFMHYKEYGRASSSSKLIPHCTNSSIYIFGDAADEKRLERVLADQNRLRGMFVLFPSATALELRPPQEFAKAEQIRFQTVPNSGSTSLSRIRDLIIVDGTWRQARTLNRRCGVTPVLVCFATGIVRRIHRMHRETVYRVIIVLHVVQIAREPSTPEGTGIGCRTDAEIFR